MCLFPCYTLITALRCSEWLKMRFRGYAQNTQYEDEHPQINNFERLGAQTIVNRC